jgi:hypothetical protein
MSGRVFKNLGGIKQPFMAVLFLLSLGVAQAFAQNTPTDTPTPTPTSPNSWVQFRYNPDNTGFNQHLDNPFFRQKWQSPLGQSDDPAIGIQGSETTNNSMRA